MHFTSKMTTSHIINLTLVARVQRNYGSLSCVCLCVHMCVCTRVGACGEGIIRFYAKIDICTVSSWIFEKNLLFKSYGVKKSVLIATSYGTDATIFLLIFR